jgi:hypothetical protein
MAALLRYLRLCVNATVIDLGYAQKADDFIDQERLILPRMMSK